jgi:hypothetical protein
MSLNFVDYVNGILFSIFVIISIYVGLRILIKYFEVKNRILIYVGMAWIFMVCPWYPSTIAFFNALIFNASPGLSPELYFLIGNIFIPLPMIFWLVALTDLLFQKYRILILISISLYSIIFYIIFFIQLFTDPSQIGFLVGDIDVKYNTISFVSFYYISYLIITLITGTLFAKQTLASEKKELRIKSRFLIIAFFLFTIGASLDAILEKDLFTILIMRAFEISSAFCFYLGFILPKRLKNYWLT